MSSNKGPPSPTPPAPSSSSLSSFLSLHRRLLKLELSSEGTLPSQSSLADGALPLPGLRVARLAVGLYGRVVATLVAADEEEHPKGRGGGQESCEQEGGLHGDGGGRKLEGHQGGGRG